MSFRWSPPQLAVSLMVLPWLSLVCLMQLAAVAEPVEQATTAGAIRAADGFHVELIYSVPQETQGSWVVLTTDPQGNLLTSDQGGRLYRIQVSVDPPVIQPLDVDLGHAQGLLFAFNSLYVMVNDGDRSGLYRARDTNEDGQFDQIERILRLDGQGEHGPHTILLSKDRQSLVICAGNHTALPELTASRVPRVWGEDQLLRRVWDPNGHAVGKLAPGGWVCRVSPDGKERELLAIGFRNEYDCARNVDGELFSFDADMEWDIGTSWYRPTRILHVTSGAEFGWRGGCYKWPEYTPDSLPSVVDMGPGSPTGIVFGTGSKFPKRYQQALFACDWGGGVMHAVHLSPHGSSYVGEAETFVSANALPFTDVTINPVDGAMYFTTGGRGAQSGLYRVTWVGDSDAAADSPRNEEIVALRRQLESLHRANAAADELELIWEHLDHADRHVRYAARTALEHLPYAAWADRLVAEQDAGTALNAMLARVRIASDLTPTFESKLTGFDFGSLHPTAQLTLLRVYELALVRHRDSVADEAAIVTQLDPHFPSDRVAQNQQLAKLLAYLDAPGVVQRCLSLVDGEATPAGKLHYLLSLQNSPAAWTIDEVRHYLKACAACKEGSGGKSYGGYVDDMVAWIAKRLDGDTTERLSLELELARQQPQAFIPEVPRSFVKEWTLAELLQQVADGNLAVQHGDTERGRRLFSEVNCAKCHRIDEIGGTVGPDLTTVAKRFNLSDLLTSMVQPDRVISDQYRFTTFEMRSGQVVTGRVTDQSNRHLKVRTDMYNPGLLTVIEKNEIESRRESPTSAMPAGLLDTLSLQEIQDLLAYLVR